jgi:hypothetical protein
MAMWRRDNDDRAAAAFFVIAAVATVFMAVVAAIGAGAEQQRCGEHRQCGDRFHGVRLLRVITGDTH